MRSIRAKIANAEAIFAVLILSPRRIDYG
jgi:hypothetical protein